MEWLQNLQDMLNDIYYSIQYAKVFALGAFICFIILFIALAVQAHKIKILQITVDNYIKESTNDSEYLIKMMEKQLKSLNFQGGNGNGTNDERSNESDFGRS